MDVSHKFKLENRYLSRYISRSLLFEPLKNLGRCTVEHLERPRDLSPSLNEDLEYPEQTHILLAGSLTITSSSRPSTTPRIYLRTPACPEHVVHCGSTRHNVVTQITALALDQSPPSSGSNIHLAAFLSTGEFAIFTLGHSTPLTSSRKLVYVPVSRNHRTSPIIQAVYHHPLLITLSKAFHLSVYDLSHNTVTHTQTLTSFTSFPPTSLVLSTPSSSTYKLVLSYTVPVYPAHWSVGATELIIAGANSPPSNSSPSETSSVFSSPPPSPMSIISTRTIRALDVPQGWIDQKKLHTMREQWSRKVSRVADTQTDGKWVVLAPSDASPTSTASLSPYDSDSSSSPSSSSSSSSSPPAHLSSSLHSPTSLQLYRLSLPSSSQFQHQHAWASSSSNTPPKLTFVRTLHGQIGPVSALALADGRCVSLGLNGSVWVWDLEGGTGAEVASVSNNPHPEYLQKTLPQKGTIAFDERRIITVGADGLVVRRFDV